MTKKPPFSRVISDYPLWLRLVLTAGLALLLAGVAQDLSNRYHQLPIASGRIPPSFLVYCLFVLLGTAFFLVHIWASNWFLPFNAWRARLGWLRWVGVALLGLLPGLFFAFSDWSAVFAGTWLRVTMALIFLGGMVWLAASGGRRSWDWAGILVSLLVFGSALVMLSYFRNVSDYPLTRTWSEGNRLWDYSVLFGKNIYLYPANKAIPAYIDIGRQSLWGLPFLFGVPTIFQMRLWDAIVWTVPYMLLGWALIRPRKGHRAAWFLFGLWALVFLFQGPIYSPLVLAAVLVALVRRQPILLAAVVVLLAGLYARYTRYTWLFAPAIWAGMLWMLQAPLGGHTSLWKRWYPAVVVALGGVTGGLIVPEILNVIWRRLYGVPFQIGTANLAELSLTSVSGNVSRQPLLFDRLWPNETYSLGIVYGLLLAVGPLVALLIYLAWKGGWHLVWWQKLSVAGAMLAFLGVGLVASVKIGGGSNLHNLDMFLIGMLFLAAVGWEYISAKWGDNPAAFPGWIKGLLVLVLIVPFGQSMLNLNTVGLPDPVKWHDALGGTQDAVAAAAKQGEVLFIDQRQLLTFGYIKGVPLVPDYEKKYMMDQAMASNDAYFAGFNRDLAAHRFKLIVTEPLFPNFQGDHYTFGNENDAWVKYISIPVLCYYEPMATYKGITQLLVPRKQVTPPTPDTVCP
jgi:hypothetical protein